MRLSTCLIKYFCEYLPRIKGVSKQTIDTYRCTFTLFLPFAAQYYSIKVSSLRIGHLSQDVILAFLDYLENQRKNIARTRNNRLAAIKSFAKMIRFMYPDQSDLIDKIYQIPEKNTQKQIIGFLYPDEMLKIFESVDLTKKHGFRNYAILHLLYDTGARASEISDANIDYFDAKHKAIAILGKGNRYRLLNILPKTVQLLRFYILKYRTVPNPIYQHYIFINSRGTKMTRYGINKICRKYLSKVLPKERFQTLNPVSSFRHSRAVDMLRSGHSLDEIKYRLGHQNINSTMVYLHLDAYRQHEIQNKLNEYLNTLLPSDPKIDCLIDWENKEKILAWIDGM